jgi:hypothetical protein
VDLTPFDYPLTQTEETKNANRRRKGNNTHRNKTQREEATPKLKNNQSIMVFLYGDLLRSSCDLNALGFDSDIEV